MRYDLTKPCPQCPFRADIPGYLRADRVAEIQHSLMFQDGSFPCHKTTVEVESEDGTDLIPGPKSQHCAGALIMQDQTSGFGQLTRIMMRVGGFDWDKLDYEAAPIYDDYRDMARGHDPEGFLVLMEQFMMDDEWDTETWDDAVQGRAYEDEEEYDE